MSTCPFGKWIFSKFVVLKAPFFGSVRPLVDELAASKCVVVMKKRRSVTNHLGTVHAIAMCNMCELAFGLTMEAGIPRHLRWIPKGMTVRYLKPGKTNLRATCDFPQIANLEPGDHCVPVQVTDVDHVVVMEADITVYISKKK